MSAQFSKLRQQINRAYTAMAAMVHRLLSSDPMVPGSLYLLRRKCGKPNCRCVAGELHARWVLTRSEQGQQRLYSVSDHTICALPAAFAGSLRGADWGRDGTIVFATGYELGGLWRVSARGGEPQRLTTPRTDQGERAHVWPHILPTVVGPRC